MNTKMKGRRRFLGVGVMAGAAPFAVLAFLMPTRAELAPVPPPTELVSATPERVSVFGDSITHSAIAQGNIANAALDERLWLSWHTTPGLSTYHFQNGFDEAGLHQPDVVVIATGTNDSVEPIGAVHATSIDNALDALAGNPCVVWVNVRSELWTNPVAWNQLLTEKAAAAGNVRVADWDGYSNGHPEWIAWDTVHLSDEGKVAYGKWLVEQMVAGCP
jgi:lysophospholipase L1-like esterase